jgi:16S rRNA (cytosine1402-N4)-methyltransferase
MTYHVPIMKDEVVQGLAIKPNGVYVDCTLGGGGHAQAILDAAPGVHLVGIDKDYDALRHNQRLIQAYPDRVTLVHSDYANVGKVLDDLGIEQIDGAILDAGVSSHQLDDASRGFAYSQDAPLDMRMDNTVGITAADVVNTYSEADLIRILKEYGEEQFAVKIVRKIVEARKDEPINTTMQLTRLIEQCVPASLRYKLGHPAKKTFQAIRIEVNGELVDLGQTVETVCERLKPQGRFAVLTFHSLEDRIVKSTFKLLSTDCICDKSIPVCVCHHKATVKLVNHKPMQATQEELKLNSRSASAKLRIVEKL